MADTKLTDLTAITTPASGDKLYIVDVDDTTDSSAGSSRQITFTNLATGVFTVFGVTASAAELNFVDGVTSAIQTQLNAKAPLASPTFTGTVTLPVALTGIIRADSGVVAVDTTAALLAGVQTITGIKTFSAQTEFSEDINLATGKNVQVNDIDPWRTIDIFGSMSPTTTAGCGGPTTVEAGTNDIDYKVLDFDTATDENAFVNFRMPDSWDAGVVQFRYTWTNAAGLTTETVTFELSGIAYANDDPIDAAVGTAIEVADTWIAQGDIHYSAWSGDVTIAGTPAAGEYVHFEIMRDVSEDDLTGDARLMNVQIRYKQAQYSD